MKRLLPRPLPCGVTTVLIVTSAVFFGKSREPATAQPPPPQATEMRPVGAAQPAGTAAAPLVRPSARKKDPPPLCWEAMVDLTEAKTLNQALNIWSRASGVALNPPAFDLRGTCLAVFSPWIDQFLPWIDLFSPLAPRPLPAQYARKGKADEILQILAEAGRFRFLVSQRKPHRLYFSDWNESLEVFVKLAANEKDWDARWGSFMAGSQLTRRTNLRLSKAATPNQVYRIDGHPDAIAEVRAWVDFQRSQILLGAVPPPPLAEDNKPKPAGKDAVLTAGGAPVGNEAAVKSATESTPPSGAPTTKTATPPDATIQPMPATDLWYKVFELRHVSVEGQTFKLPDTSGSDKSTVKTPGIAELVSEIAFERIGDPHRPTKLASRGVPTEKNPGFEKAVRNLQRLNSVSESAYRNLQKQEAWDSILDGMDKAKKREAGELGNLASAPDTELTKDDYDRYVEQSLVSPSGVEKMTAAGDEASSVRSSLPKSSDVYVMHRQGPAASPWTVFERGLGPKPAGAKPKGSAAKEQQPGGIPKLSACIIAERATNRLIICDTVDNLKIYEEIIADLDKAPRLIEITATILDINASSGLEWGIDWAGLGTDELDGAVVAGRTLISGGQKYTGVLPKGYDKAKKSPPGSDLFPFLGGTASPLNPPGINPAGFSASTLVTGTAGRLAARIRALEVEGKAQVLSRPSVLTVNMTDALFYDQDSIFLPAPGEYNADLFRVNAPVSMRIRPVILSSKPGERSTDYDAKEGGILLDVEILDDAFSGTTTIRQSSLTTDDQTDNSPDPGLLQVPLVSESTIHTQAVVRRDQSLLIGGRLRHVQQSGSSGVPLLSRIPVLGAAFKDKQVKEIKYQRLFLITPREITPAAPDSTFSPSAK